MSLPKPPFHSASEELLYNIYLKLSGNMGSLTTSDIDTLAKLNAILTDADLMKAEDIINSINALKGNVPAVGDTLEKLYNIIRGLNFLTAQDIDTLAELNAIIIDADVIKTEDLTTAINGVKGNVPNTGDTLEKLNNLLAPILPAFVPGGNNVGSIKPIGTKDNFALPFIINNVERARINETGSLLLGYSGAIPDFGLNGYKLQILSSGALGLGVSGSSLFRDGNFNINLGQSGNAAIKNSFRINSFVAGLGGYDFLLSANNVNAVLEITDLLIGGTKNEMLRLNAFDHHGTFIRMEEKIGSTGTFIEAYRLDAGSMALKFSIDKDGVLSLGQINYDPVGIDPMARLYFRDDQLRYVTAEGEIRVVTTDRGD